jgi:UDP-glucose 4-epimerase
MRPAPKLLVVSVDEGVVAMTFLPFRSVWQVAVADGRGSIDGPRRDRRRAAPRFSARTGRDPMNVLVTGGAGYVGSVATEALLARGHRVVVVDDLRTGHREAVPDGAAFVLADVADPDLVGFAIEEHGVEAIVHFAASSLVGASMEAPLDYFDNNVGGALRLWRTALRHGVRKVVVSSTAALYGTPDVVPIPETAPLHPESVYGETKWQLERTLTWLARTAGMGVVALRYFNAAGASATRGEDHRPESHLIPLVLQVAAGRRPHVAIYGDDYPTPDGTAVRDYVHVEDLAEAHVAALEAVTPGTARAYNLGNGQGYSVREVVKVVARVTGCEVATVAAPRRAGDPPVLVADAAAARRELGWTPRRPDLDRIVADAWAWHQAHPDGYPS